MKDKKNEFTEMILKYFNNYKEELIVDLKKVLSLNINHEVEYLEFEVHYIYLLTLHPMKEWDVVDLGFENNNLRHPAEYDIKIDFESKIESLLSSIVQYEDVFEDPIMKSRLIFIEWIAHCWQEVGGCSYKYPVKILPHDWIKYTYDLNNMKWEHNEKNEF
ncbi:hypothetical protein [Paenibacillus qinlingensis]|uniref:hypothetical protein n=1 Tax=Paenibacillus qinlingensis TaxID=1837343 RepID=UPI0015665A6B|nr:hypothetical protein [Paenibacillus qinlingensis]NQX62355.1 hypothetical protein [Paenibacillus qinlingensis]